MAVSDHDYIRNIGIMSGGVTAPPHNAPKQYGQRKRQYLGNESNAFMKQFAKYSSDFFSADCQGLNPQDFFAWTSVNLRMADVVRPSAALTRYIDDWKMILVDSEAVDYIPQGAKIVTMGSTWLVVYPENITSAYGTGIVRRCNGVWNHLDYYGNILQEPIIIEKAAANASANDAQDHLLITMGYYNIVMQKNKWTSQLTQNSRIILGDWAFQFTGPGDFVQEFSGDYDSVRLVYFAARYDEPNDAIDDMENHVAGGKTFQWDISITGVPAMEAGSTTVYSAASQRNGETVEDTSEHPVFYLWSSSDDSVATVDAIGVVTAVAPGTCEITCQLAQNPAQSATQSLTVVEATTGPSVRFTGTVPTSLGVLESTTITAAYFEDGIQKSGDISWSFSGADTGTYKALLGENSAYITCYGPSATALQITAECKGVHATAQISLEGV